VNFKHWAPGGMPNELPPFGYVLKPSIDLLLLSAARDGQIQPGDALLLLAVLPHVGPQSGRAERLTADDLAQATGIAEAEVQEGLARLQEAGLLVQGIERGPAVPFVMANPQLFIFGGPVVREWIREQWYRSNAPEELRRVAMCNRRKRPQRMQSKVQTPSHTDQRVEGIAT